MALYSSMSNDFSRRSNLCVNIDIVYFISTSFESNENTTETQEIAEVEEVLSNPRNTGGFNR